MHLTWCSSRIVRTKPTRPREGGDWLLREGDVRVGERALFH